MPDRGPRRSPQRAGPGTRLAESRAGPRGDGAGVAGADVGRGRPPWATSVSTGFGPVVRARETWGASVGRVPAARPDRARCPAGAARERDRSPAHVPSSGPPLAGGLG